MIDQESAEMLHRIMWSGVVLDTPRDHETLYDQLYTLWHQSEREFWTPMIGVGETMRFGYRDDVRAWDAIKRVNRLDRGVPPFNFARVFGREEDA